MTFIWWKIVILFLIGFGQSLIGTLAGSGGLISFPVLLLLGVPVHATIAAGKFSNTIGSFSGLVTMWRRSVFKPKTLLAILPFSLGGGVVGSVAAAAVSNNVMKIVAVILLCFALFLTFLKSPNEEGRVQEGMPRGLYPEFFGVGIYSGAFGPGQGTLLLQLLFRRGISYVYAVAITRANAFFSSAGAAVVFMLLGDMLWHVAVPLTVGAVSGAQIAVRLAPKLSKQTIQWVVRIITALLIGQFVYQAFF